MINPQVVTVGPAQLLQRLEERCHVGLPFGIASVGGGATEYAYAPHARTLLRVGRDRPCACRTTEQRDERASVHSMTSSARASNDGGTVRPSVLAVLRLITSSNLVG